MEKDDRHIKLAQSWEDVVIYLETIRRNRLKGFHAPVFRGQSNATWALDSTLQRVRGRGTYIKEYYDMILSKKPMIQSLSGRIWDDFVGNPTEEFWEAMRNDRHPPLYDYMVYLRHCGFPSPLLDWSVSPYVALFFACIATPEIDGAFYALFKSKKPDIIDGADFEYWTVKLLDAEVQSHDRHFRQMAKYSISFATRPSIPGEKVYVQYEDGIFTLAPSPIEIYSLQIAKELKPEILNRLDDFGVNSYTLFGGEDNLVKSIADRIFLQSQPSTIEQDTGSLIQLLVK